MTSLKTKNICFLAAFLFLAIVPTLAKVVNEVKDCNQFLYPPGTPPEIPGVLEKGANKDQNRYKVICQTFNGEPRFLTVYDTKNKIPVFSAYEYKGSAGGRPSNPWKIEPQLDQKPDQNNVNMKADDEPHANQAIDNDYKNAKTIIGDTELKYDRGHLFPSSHGSNQDVKISTFTLTNIVPQVDTFNQQRWSTMEQCITCILDYKFKKGKRCFVVVGAQPSDKFLNDNDNNKKKINIPSVMWSAFYCDDKMSGAYWSENNAGDTVHEVTLEELKKNPLTKGIDVFPGQSYVNYLRDIFAAMGRLITG